MSSRPLLRRLGYSVAIGVAAIWGVGFATQLSTGAVRKIRIHRAVRFSSHCIRIEYFSSARVDSIVRFVEAKAKQIVKFV